MKRNISIKQYVIQQNEDGDLLVVFYQATKKDYVASCVEKKYYLKDDELIVELNTEEEYSLNLIFKGLEQESIVKLNNKNAVMILELDSSDNNQPYHYIVVKEEEIA
jgi:hypothetical protein